ncbi:MAG TPA: radical SAM family heme chaperone HemW [bacterium]|nr:radical SAM family heme chaperone HemW [bacterium]
MTAAGAYVHIPFCAAKCDYCDFFSVVVPDAVRRQVLAVMLDEIGQWQDREVGTVYIGGGNPGLLTDSELIRLVTVINQAWRVPPKAEWTIEMRPETVTRARCDLLRGLGITRISVGVQSFLDTERAALGRGGNDGDLRRALELLAAEWDNWNIDLIYGLPGQTPASWQESLVAARGYRPPHVSLYDLTLGEDTLLTRRVNEGSVLLPDEDDTVRMLRAAQETLAAGGYEQYEVSNWAQPGFRCRHNVNYWRGCDYIGIGPGAVSTWQGKRWRRCEDLAAYLASRGCAAEDEEIIDDAIRRREAVILGLRMADGIDRCEFSERFGSDPVLQFPAAVARWQQSGDLAYDDVRLWITAQGMRWSSAIIADLME